MNYPLFAALLALTLLAACGRKPAAAPLAQAQPAEPPASAPADAPAASTPDAAADMAADTAPAVEISAPENGNMSRTLSDLSQAVRSFIASHHRRPASFEEFAVNCQVAIPPPPPGKRYGFDPKYNVILMSQ